MTNDKDRGEVRNESQPTSSQGRGPDVRVKDRPLLCGKESRDLFAVGLTFLALQPSKGLK